MKFSLFYSENHLFSSNLECSSFKACKLTRTRWMTLTVVLFPVWSYTIPATKPWSGITTVAVSLLCCHGATCLGAGWPGSPICPLTMSYKIVKRKVITIINFETGLKIMNQSFMLQPNKQPVYSDLDFKTCIYLLLVFYLFNNNVNGHDFMW